MNGKTYYKIMIATFLCVQNLKIFWLLNFFIFLVCDTIYQLLLDKPVPRLTAEDEIEADDQRRLEQQPKVFFPTDVEVSQDSLLGTVLLYFSKLFRHSQKLLYSV